MVGKTKEIHVRISDEQKEFLKTIDINVSELVRDAIYNLMLELPDELMEQKKQHQKQIEEIDHKLAELKKKKDGRSAVCKSLKAMQSARLLFWLKLLCYNSHYEEKGASLTVYNHLFCFFSDFSYLPKSSGRAGYKAKSSFH